MIISEGMNHDVFISYSHKNITAAQAICHELEDKGIKCWMAPRDIPVGAKYASVISKAIVHSRIVVLVFSDYSARSPWVESEINIAFSNRKTIIPYKIDKTNYEEFDEFYLMLNNRHWIEAYPDYKTRFKELVTIVAQTLGRNVSASKPAESREPAPTPIPIPTPTPSEPKNLKRYWWVALCVLAVGCAMWYISTDKLESVDTPVENLAEVAGASAVSAVQNVVSESDAELQHSNAELQNSNSDLQKNINDFKAKEAQQANNKNKENQTVKSPTQKQPETKPSTSTPKVEQKSVQTTTLQKAETEEDIVPITQPQEQVKQEVVVSQPETPKEKIIVKNNEYAGRSEREIYLLNLSDNEFNEFLEKNMWGFKLKTEIVIIPKYSNVHRFSEGLAAVKLENRWGFVDKTGKEVIDLKYDYVDSFHEGLAAVQLENRWGFIDKTGKEVIDLKYDGAYSFDGGKANVLLNGEEFYIDKNGNRIEEKSCRARHSTEAFRLRIGVSNGKF